MMTSYFARIRTLDIDEDRLVSIALKSPPGFRGRKYKALAPSWGLLQYYRNSHDEEGYTIQYLEQILHPLNPQSVLQELGKNSILLCWEAPGKFCHRRIVANWFFDKLGIPVPELGPYE